MTKPHFRRILEDSSMRRSGFDPSSVHWVTWHWTEVYSYYSNFPISLSTPPQLHIHSPVNRGSTTNGDRIPNGPVLSQIPHQVLEKSKPRLDIYNQKRFNVTNSQIWVFEKITVSLSCQEISLPSKVTLRRLSPIHIHHYFKTSFHYQPPSYISPRPPPTLLSSRFVI